MGHATLLVQMEGVTFLTDPMFSQRCSPVQVCLPCLPAASACPRVLGLCAVDHACHRVLPVQSSAK